MSTKVLKVCDICHKEEVVTHKDDEVPYMSVEIKLANESYYSRNSEFKAVFHDLQICPDCAEKLGIVKIQNGVTIVNGKNAEPEKTTKEQLYDLFTDIISEIVYDKLQEQL
jgi:hypothetical protein